MSELRQQATQSQKQTAETSRLVLVPKGQMAEQEEGL
eukprot:COSAG06_NODE_47333_length_346_cov_0.564315_1_plen_36_part_10